jgi:hypothetical protein
MVQTWTGLWFCAAIVAASFAVAPREAAEPTFITSGSLPPPPLSPSSIGGLQSISTADPSTIETATRTTHPLETQSTTPSVTVQDIAHTSTPATGTRQTKDDEDKSPTAAEPDVSLQTAFLVLETFLALAGVVVAVFFGYKQLSFMRNLSSIGRNDVHDSGSDVDLEMGPATTPSDSAPLIAQPPATDQILTHTLGTRFAYLLNKLKSMYATPIRARPTSRREGQSSISPPTQNLASVYQDPTAPTDNLHQQQGRDVTHSTAIQRV